MKNIGAFFCTLIFCLTSQAAEYETDTLTISSEVLEEERVALIYTTSVFDRDDTIQIIYMPDGEFSGNRFNSLINSQNTGQIVGVGIKNINRRKELLLAYNADKFLEFIVCELIPAVEDRYPVKQRIMYGHSFGGSFTLYAMLNQPGLFDKYIASSPTPIMDMIDSTSYLKLDSMLEKEICFYFSHGSKDMKQVRIWSGRLYGNIQGLTLDKVRWKYEVFKDKNHNTSDKISLIQGLNY
jgi:predicted alpha/beta superfamily hydrolase